jgi:transcriptional regulator with XRE-family HTH domain
MIDRHRSSNHGRSDRIRSISARLLDDSIIYDHMKLHPVPPTPAALQELGRRLAEVRKQRGLTQEELAQRAGLGVATLRRIEDGRDARLGSWVRLLQALDLSSALDRLLPEDLRSPLAEARAESRAPRGSRRSGPDFVWGDERP